MSTISYIPGRVRLENDELINQPRRCQLVAQRLNALGGVTDVEVNQRTGRILIHFDESMIERDLLLAKVTEFANAAETAEKSEVAGLTVDGSPVTNKKQRLSHLAIDLAGHVLLPGPLGVLFPFAVNAFRKSPA
ncbi:MAG: hypothetical protein HYS23_11805 [Geobacter sp.]|nr:hypothetical protein [Geobacter sp.]